ncbi:MAG: NADH-quinone oxidoreductase subunit M [Actinomycetota bacterium]|nr:NADH-quinone oxidoreductase subunit M [Actinomycetota bacterium]
MNFNILSALVFLPILGLILVMVLPKSAAGKAKVVSLVFAVLTVITAAYIWITFDKTNPSMQFVEKYSWVKGVNIYYHLGVDGISLPIVVLICILTVLGILVSWNTDNKPKAFFALLLLLQTGMLGVFLSLDFILFYIFWELVLLPMYFLIGIWGSSNRLYACIKFFIYTLFGSVLMLVGILIIFFKSGINSFDMLELVKNNLSPGIQNWVFLLMFMGFAIKVPMFPLHTWLPDAHTEAPTAGSVLLAGILLKMGAYGFIRISIPILPYASKSWAPAISILAVTGIVYGALACLVQKDVKRLIAFSSVSHMGFVMLGIASLNPTAITGSVLQMFNHGCITGMLFLVIGMIYERTHTRQISELGGLANKMPFFAAMLAFASFASLGLPGLSGFWGEFLILFGTFKNYTTFYQVMVYIAVIGMVLGAAYLLWMLQRVIFGEYKGQIHEFGKVSAVDIVTLIPLIIIIIFIGIYPSSLVNVINISVTKLMGM